VQASGTDLAAWRLNTRILRRVFRIALRSPIRPSAMWPMRFHKDVMRHMAHPFPPVSKGPETPAERHRNGEYRPRHPRDRPISAAGGDSGRLSCPADVVGSPGGSVRGRSCDCGGRGIRFAASIGARPIAAIVGRAWILVDPKSRARCGPKSRFMVPKCR